MNRLLQFCFHAGQRAAGALLRRAARMLKRRWVTPCTLGAGTALIGSLSGFALFIMVWQEPGPGWLGSALILILAAVLSFIFEHLRARIEGHEERMPSFGGICTTVLMLAMFELFVTALHSAGSAKPKELAMTAVAIIGPGIWTEGITAAINLLLMTGVWLLIAVLLGGTLGKLIERFAQEAAPKRGAMASSRWRHVRVGSLVGGLAGLIIGPGCVLLYLICLRGVAELEWMGGYPGAWQEHVSAVQNSVPWQWYSLALKPMIAGIAAVGRWGRPPVAALVSGVILYLLAGPLKRGLHPLVRAFLGVNALAAVTLVFVSPLAGGMLPGGFNQEVLKLLYLVALVWSVPGLILGATVSHLERPSENRRIWGLVAFGVAAALALSGRHFSGLVLAGVGVMLLARIPIERYWPLLAFSSALVVFGFTEIAVANFVDIQDRSLSVINAPLEVASSDPAQETQFNQLWGSWWEPPPSDPAPAAPIEMPMARLEPYATLVSAAAPEGCDWANLLDATAEALQQHRERAEKLAATAERVPAIEEKALGTIIGDYFPGSTTDSFLKQSPKDQDIKDMGKYTVVKGSLEEPQLTRVEAIFEKRITTEMSQAEEAGRQANRNVFAATAELELACSESPGSRDFCAPGARSSEKKKIAAVRSAAVGLAASLAALKTADLAFETQQERQNAVASAAGQNLRAWHDQLIEELELCINASLGFWITIGLLAGWAHEKRKTSARA